jgi:crotonobetainyl-CoA:carnitine CoA-transferase CaiB-like acyl-CoA transferase
VFACAGDDDWCVVEVRGDADWQALCAVIERADLAADPALAGAAGRDAQRDRLDEAVAAWLAGRTPVEAMEALQGAGVPAGAMLRIAELPHFGYFRQRGLFEFLTQAQLEAPWPVDNAPVRAEHLARPPLGPAPLRGEHTRQLARDILGLGDEEIERMIAAGVLEAPAAATEIDPR